MSLKSIIEDCTAELIHFIGGQQAVIDGMDQYIYEEPSDDYEDFFDWDDRDAEPIRRAPKRTLNMKRVIELMLKNRAQNLVTVFEAALRLNQLEPCIWCILDQWRILNHDPEAKTAGAMPPGAKYNFLFQGQGTFMVTADLPHASQIEHQFYDIIKKYQQRLLSFMSPNRIYFRDNTGVQIVHRVWVGAHPSPETLNRIAAGNLAVIKRWRDATTKQPIPAGKIRQILWTNNRALLEHFSHSNNLEIRNVEELFGGIGNGFRPLVHAMWARKEFAFSADILRFLALFNYGGMYIDCTWTAGNVIQPRRDVPEDDLKDFIPSAATVRMFCMDQYPGRPVNYRGKHGDFSNVENFEYAELNRRFSPIVQSHVGTNVCYFGVPHHPVLARCLEINKDIVSWSLTNNKGDESHFTKYRTIKYQTALDKWKRSPGQDYKAYCDEIADILYKYSPGTLTELYPIIQALTDFGYIDITNPNAADSMELDEYCKFHAYSVGKSMEIPSLGICREHSSSWLKLDFKARLSTEI